MRSAAAPSGAAPTRPPTATPAASRPVAPGVVGLYGACRPCLPRGSGRRAGGGVWQEGRTLRVCGHTAAHVRGAGGGRVGAAEGGAEGGGPQWGGSWPTIPCRRGSPLSRSRHPDGCQYQATSPRPAGHARPCTDLDRSKRFGSPPPRTPSRPACSRPAAPKRRCTPRRD